MRNWNFSEFDFLAFRLSEDIRTARGLAEVIEKTLYRYLTTGALKEPFVSTSLTTLLLLKLLKVLLLAALGSNDAHPSFYKWDIDTGLKGPKVINVIVRGNDDKKDESKKAPPMLSEGKTLSDNVTAATVPFICMTHSDVAAKKCASMCIYLIVNRYIVLRMCNLALRR
jgi:hypothetical protein